MTRMITVYTKNLKQSGFTMIEITVVMAIIFMLMAMGMSTYHRARQAALRTTCMANIKTIICSTNMYLTDNKGYMIPHKNSSGQRWPEILVKNEYMHEGTYFEPVGITEGNARDVGQEPLFCPNDTSDENLFFVTKYENGGSYAINRDITSSPTVNLKWSHIQNPQNKILFCDYNQQGIESSKNYMVSAETNRNNWATGGSKNEGTVGVPHFGTSNVMYADWHAGPMEKADLKEDFFSLEMNYR